MTLIGLAIAGVAAVVYWLSNKNFDASRGDFFYLADAFLRGRTWLDVALRAERRHPRRSERSTFRSPRSRQIALMPLVAIVGPMTADQWETGINALLAGCVVGLGWWLLGRVGVQKTRRPRSARHSARILHPDLVGDDARRRVAHGSPHRDDPDARSA